MFILSEAFRCGLFFPPEVEGELPIAPLYIFNASFPASECPTENTDRFYSFCHSIVSILYYGEKKIFFNKITFLSLFFSGPRF